MTAISNPQNASLSSSNTSAILPEDGYMGIMEAAYFLNEYYLWVIFVIGFPGNLATIITIFRMRSLGSFTLYVVILAVMDNLAICIKISIYQLYRSKVNLTTPGCRITDFFANFVVTSTNWVLVVMAVERLLAVRYPLRVQKLMSCRRSIAALSVVGLVIAGLYAPIFWVGYYNPQHKMCMIDNSYVKIRAYLQWANVSLFAFLPFAALVVCNILIVRVIRASFRVRTALRSLQYTVAATRRKSSCYRYDMCVQRQITIMLFTSTFAFVMLLFPICAFFAADISWNYKPFTKAYAIKYLLYQMTYILCDSTHAVNFYLYFLSAKKFRNHFLAMSSCATPTSRATSV